MNNVIGFPIILISWIVVYTVDSVIQCSNKAGPEPGGKRRGLGLRNNVLITCKAVTLPCGQQIIIICNYCSISKVNILEARSELAEDIFQWLKKYYHGCLFFLHIVFVL